MNERIRELMNKSMEPTGLEGLGGSYMELNPEKFAELLIRECCDLFEQNTTPAEAVALMKNHFGISTVDSNDKTHNILGYKMTDLMIFIGENVYYNVPFDDAFSIRGYELFTYPEQEIHPKQQREFAREVVRRVNSGEKIMLVTYSDYIIKEINTSIMLNYFGDYGNDIDFYGNMYEKLSKEKVSCFDMNEDGEIKQCTVDDRGIWVRSFDNEIEEMDDIQNEIFYGE